MALLPKRSEEEKRAASARGDLEAAQKKLASLLARESVAAASADRWAQWTAERDAVSAEVERCTVRLGHLEAAVDAAKHEADIAEKTKRVEACRAAQDALKIRLRDDGARMLTGLATLARDTAAATLEAQRLNAILPPGVAPIEIADFSLRELPRLPREDIATTEQVLWVNAAGNLIGSQEDVVADQGGDTGYIAINKVMRIECFKRRFRSTTYHPAFTADHPNHFFSLLRLPFVDRPGVAFDGSLMTAEATAVMSVELPTLPKPSSRSVMVELTPIEPWTPAGVATAADRNSL